MWGAALLGGLGALAGMQGQRQTSSVQLAPPSEAELAGGRAVTSTLPELQNLVGQGPGSQAITAATNANQQLAGLLQSFMQQGGNLPTAADMSAASQFAQAAMQPQQVAINQQFNEERQRANQLAAQLGRPVNDPIIQAKLSQERMRAQERLGASQSAFASEFALQQPQQRLGYAAQLANLQQGLASQALANRQALLSLGSQIQGQGQSFRAGTAQREVTSGGGLAGAISGGLAGFGTGLNIGNMFGAAMGAGAVQAASGGSGLQPVNLGSSMAAPSTGYNLGGNYNLSAPALSSPAAAFRSNISQFSAPAVSATAPPPVQQPIPYRGPLSPIQPYPASFNYLGRME